jgi:hypothetical protein
MKKCILFILFTGAIAGTLFSQQVRLTGQWAIQAGDSKVFSSAKEGNADHLGGLGVEIVLHHLGFGATGLVSFQEYETESWLVDWDLRTYMSYHFFRRRSFLDPFIQAGFGAAGDVGISGAVCYNEDYTEVQRVALAFYPYIGGGLGLQFKGGLYLAGQFNWRPVSGGLPYTTIDVYEVNEFEVVFSLGFAFGGRH